MDSADQTARAEGSAGTTTFQDRNMVVLARPPARAVLSAESYWRRYDVSNLPVTHYIQLITLWANHSNDSDMQHPLTLEIFCLMKQNFTPNRFSHFIIIILAEWDFEFGNLDIPQK